MQVRKTDKDVSCMHHASARQTDSFKGGTKVRQALKQFLKKADSSYDVRIASYLCVKRHVLLIL